MCELYRINEAHFSRSNNLQVMLRYNRSKLLAEVALRWSFSKRCRPLFAALLTATTKCPFILGNFAIASKLSIYNWKVFKTKRELKGKNLVLFDGLVACLLP